jgi:hypothetical protein
MFVIADAHRDLMRWTAGLVWGEPEPQPRPKPKPKLKSNGHGDAYLFSPGVCWSGLILNLSGCEVQALQTNSYG